MTAPHLRYYPRNEALGFAPAGHPYKGNGFGRVCISQHGVNPPTGVHNPAVPGLLGAGFARTDKEIDALVYQPYGLTEEEIKVVEEHLDKQGVRPVTFNG